MIHSILIIGQSNMAGRGYMNCEGLIDNPNIHAMRNGIFRPMYRPVNPDRSFSGVCLAESFADEYSKEHEGVTVGIIPCADGGTCLDQWQEGSLLYDNAVNCARLAQRTSHIVAILWHQGEGDCREERYPLYEEKCMKIMESMRRDLGLCDVPLLLGGLGDYLKDYINHEGKLSCINYPHINAALQKMAAKLPKCAYVSAEGLKPNPDNLHFSTPALYEFGRRYYAEFKKLEDKERIFEEKSDMWTAIRTGLEML